jgi:hypothetical protein
VSRLAKAAYIAATVVVVAVVLASLGGYAVYRRLDGNVSVVKVSGLSHRSVYGAQNILLLGSQTRQGQRAGDLGSNPSLNTSNSDNLLLVHLNPAHTRAMVLSIPRDTMVYEPGCRARRTIGTGIMGPYQSAIIDGAMNIGGPSCAVSTVKDQKVNSQGILNNSVELLRIADVATRALTVDQGLDSAGKLLGLARSLTGLHAKNVTLLTMPTITDPADINRLLPEEPADDVIFQMILDGQTWHQRLPTLPDHQVRVRVLNGAGLAGLARQTARRLARLGFDVTGTGDAPATSATTVTYSGTARPTVPTP